MQFEDYLRELADLSHPPRSSQLTNLSDLSSEQQRAFVLTWPGIDVGRRRQVIQQLVDLVEDNVELNFDAVFLASLGDSDAEVRVESIRGLWEYEGRNLVEPLLRLLQEDDSDGVRAEAALALGRFVLMSEYGSLRSQYSQRVESALGRVLANPSEPEEVRARALEAIGACSNRPWVRQAIREAYESDVQRLKTAAVQAMGRGCDPCWLPILAHELRSEDAEARYEAAIACGTIGDETSVPLLAPLLSDGDPEVQAAAIAALGEIGGAEAKSLLLALAHDPSLAVEDIVREALTELGFGEDPLASGYQS